jgi:hypothetical protein
VLDVGREGRNSHVGHVREESRGRGRDARRVPLAGLRDHRHARPARQRPPRRCGRATRRGNGRSVVGVAGLVKSLAPCKATRSLLVWRGMRTGNVQSGGPLSTRGGTRCVRLVRQKGRDVSS